MATIANLNILLSLKDNASGALTKAGKNIQSWGQSLQNVGAGLTAGITAPVLGMAVVAVKAASDLQESMSAVQQVYGSAADTVVKSSQEAARAVGLSQQEYLSTAAVLGVYGDTLGLTDSATADFSDSLITAAADLGSFYNANTPEVLGAMQAALRGEFDPLERFGIMMNQAALEQYALEQGIWDGNGAMTAQQKILAAQGFILDNMGNATGDFARTSGGLANQQKILKAQLKNTAATMGAVLLPTITKAVKVFGELLTRFQNISPEWQKWIVIIGLAVAAIGPFLLVLGTILTMLPAIGAALAVLTGPIGLVIAAIALLTAAYVGNWWGFRDAVDGVGGSIADAVTWFGNLTAVQVTVDAFVTAVTGLLDRVVDGFVKIGTAVRDGDWRKALAGVGDVLSAPAKAIGDFIKNIQTGFEPIDSLLTNIGNSFTDFGRIIQELFQGDFSGAFDVLERMIGRIPIIVQDAFNLVKIAADSIVEKFGELGPRVLKWARDAIEGINWGSLWNTVVDVTGTVVGKLGDLKGKITGWIRNAIPTDWTTFFSGITIPDIPGLDAMKTVLDGVKSAAESIGTAISDAATAVAGVTISLPAGLQTLIDKLQSAIDTAQKLIDLLPFVGGGDSSEYDQAMDDARKILRGPGGGGSSPARMVVPEPDLSIFNLAFTSAIPTTIDTAAGVMADKIAAVVIPAPVTTEFDAAVATFPITLGSAMQDALRVAETNARSIVSTVSSILTGLGDAGRNATIGLANGMLSAIAAVESAALQVALTARQAVENALKVKSPSRVFEEIGGYLSEGLALGMRRGTPQVAVAARGMAAAASTNVQADFSASGGGYGGRGGGGGGFQNYGTYYEADRQWEPQNILNSYSIARSR